jgi:hypothetical protein
MKRNSSLWLQEIGTREGNQVIYRRAYVPSHLTDIRETFKAVQRQMVEEMWINYMEEKHYIDQA